MSTMTEEKIIEILTEINPGGDFVNSADLIGDGLIDSFAVINLVSDLEDEFDVEISVKDVVRENFKTVKTIAALIKRASEED